MPDDAALNICDLKPGFGAEVMDVQFANADSTIRQALVDTFHRHGAMLLRGQDMTPDDLMAFVSLFGDPEGHTQEQFTLPGYPKIFLLSNRVENGRPIGAHFDGVGWHTDYSYKDTPVMCTILYALEVPEEGGDTLFADLCAAYQALSPARQKELDGLVLHHSYKFFMENREYGAKKLSEREIRENPDVFHPLIRTHPVDGRKALWVSTGTVKGIVGMPNDEAMELLDELLEFVTQEEFIVRHKWQVGDLIMWDNRCTLHTGTLYDDSKYFRLTHRTWVMGDKPFGPATELAETSA